MAVSGEPLDGRRKQGFWLKEEIIMRVALYARVSTVGLGQDPNVQLRELREYVALRK